MASETGAPGGFNPDDYRLTDEEIAAELEANKELADKDPELYESLVESLQEMKEGRVVPFEVSWQEHMRRRSAYRALKEQMKTSA